MKLKASSHINKCRISLFQEKNLNYSKILIHWWVHLIALSSCLFRRSMWVDNHQIHFIKIKNIVWGLTLVYIRFRLWSKKMPFCALVMYIAKILLIEHTILLFIRWKECEFMILIKLVPKIKLKLKKFAAMI